MHKPKTLPRSATLSYLPPSSLRNPRKRIHSPYLRKASVKCLSEDCLILSRLKTSKFNCGISQLFGFNDTLFFCFVFNPDFKNNASVLYKLKKKKKKLLNNWNYASRNDTSALYFSPHINISKMIQCKNHLPA